MKTTSKWLFDGSSNHSTYKQVMNDEFCDGSIFLTAMVPLRITKMTSNAEKIVWVKQTPSSTRFCRLLSFEFTKETEELAKSHFSKLKKETECMEMVLHIAYRLDIKRWRVISAAEKNAVQSRKDTIQDRFWKEEGLIIDIVKRGHGTSNDGNTARRFFRKPDTASSITCVDVHLITRLGTILE
ncbi:Acetyl-coenzyme A synthetase, partial [Frankliniella fusca]